MLRATTLLLLSAAPGGHAFLFNAFTAFPALKELADAPTTDTQLRIVMEVGGTGQENHLFLDGLDLECLHSVAKAGAVNMPGADGPHPQTSSGKKEIHVSRRPFYVGMNGKQEVALEHGAWEMVWKKDAPSGNLICGFDVRQKAMRNDHTAHLPAGRLYLSFPIWTPDLLRTAREKKASALERRDEHAQEMNRCFAEMAATDNLIKKAFLYRDAAQAYEKMDLTGWRWYQWVPEGDAVLPWGDGVLVGQEGSVWSKGNDRFSPKKVVGKATIRLDAREAGTSALHP